jgi:hypothetical protein
LAKAAKILNHFAVFALFAVFASLAFLSQSLVQEKVAGIRNRAEKNREKSR